jgi:hypothetical protein
MRRPSVESWVALRAPDGCGQARNGSLEPAATSRVDNGAARYSFAGLLTDFLYRVRGGQPADLALPPYQGF